MSRVLIVSQEKLGPRMAGPAIRSWELAQALAGTNQVTLATPGPIQSAGPKDVTVVEARQSTLGTLVAEAEVILGQPSVYTRFGTLREGPAARVVDLYDPSVIEGLEIHRDLPAAARHDRQQQDLAELGTALSLGDYFICASEAQRDFWLGLLVAAGRVNAENYRVDRTLRSLIDLCPFGVTNAEPASEPGCFRSRFPAIEEGDPVVVWTGGIWNWFDPLTLLRGMALAIESVPRLRLVFLGAGHPEPGVPAMATEAGAHQLSRALHLTGRHVFFNDEWLPYAERGKYLREATFAASLHFETVESTLAFRTRLLDHLWAGLPSIVTTGDTLGDAIVSAGAGIPVEAERVDQVAAALVRLSDPSARAGFAAGARTLAARYRWSVVTRRLAAYCEAPAPAADRGARRAAGFRGGSATLRRARQALIVLRRDGPGALAERARRSVRERVR